jgi:putative ABC transport system permease protein
MKLHEALRSAGEALAAHKLRSALTMLGIVIGVAAVIAMVAVGGGAREQVVAQIRSLGANLLIVLPGNITIGGVRLGSGAQNSLTDEDAVAIAREIPSVQTSASTVRVQAQIVANAQNWSTGVFGVTLGFYEAREWEVEQGGRLFSDEEIQRGGQVILLGRTVVQNLFGQEDPVGQVVRVRNVPMTVIGVLARKGQSALGQDQDDTAHVPLITGRSRLQGTNRANARSVGQILVKVREGEDLNATLEEVRQLQRQRHRLQPEQEDDFNIRNLTEIAATREASARTLALLLAAVAGVSLAVGGIGIMNIMLVSVTERTREIGLRLAVGARKRDILRQFLIEATLLAALGGIVGVALGMGAAQAISVNAGWPLTIDPLMVVGAVTFSGMVGVFFGWYPAWRAAQLDPVEALRST